MMEVRLRNFKNIWNMLGYTRFREVLREFQEPLRAGKVIRKGCVSIAIRNGQLIMWYHDDGGIPLPWGYQYYHPVVHIHPGRLGGVTVGITTLFKTYWDYDHSVKAMSKEFLKGGVEVLDGEVPQIYPKYTDKRLVPVHPRLSPNLRSALEAFLKMVRWRFEKRPLFVMKVSSDGFTPDAVLIQVYGVQVVLTERGEMYAVVHRDNIAPALANAAVTSVLTYFYDIKHDEVFEPDAPMYDYLMR